MVSSLDSIDQSSPIPVHYQLRELLRRRIESGAYRPGDRFPTSRALREQYRLSVTTVERALAWLAENRLIRRAPGRGTVVTGHPVTEGLNRLVGLREQAQDQGLAHKTRVLRAEFVQPTERHAQTLGLRRDESAFRLDRLLTVGGGDSTCLELHVFPPEVGERMVAQPELMEGAIYPVLESAMGWQVDTASQTMGAAAASRQQAELLRVPYRTPLIRYDRIAYLSNGRPIQLHRCYLPADRFAFHLWLKRNEGGSADFTFGNSRVSTPAFGVWDE